MIQKQESQSKITKELSLLQNYVTMSSMQTSFSFVLPIFTQIFQHTLLVEMDQLLRWSQFIKVKGRTMRKHLSNNENIVLMDIPKVRNKRHSSSNISASIVQFIHKSLRTDLRDKSTLIAALCYTEGWSVVFSRKPVCYWERVRSWISY